VQRIEHGETQSPGVFQQKPGTQLFFFRKTRIIASEIFQVGPALLY